MKLEVPVYNEDGSVSAMMNIPPEQAQMLLQFALNFMAAAGLSATIVSHPLDDTPAEFDD